MRSSGSNRSEIVDGKVLVVHRRQRMLHALISNLVEPRPQAVFLVCLMQRK